MKVLAGMQWAADNLADDVLYSTADDDMSVDVLKLQEEIEKAKARTTINKWPEFPIVCSYDMWKKLGVPQRNTVHKNFVPKQKYRWTKWPKFCLGGMYTTSVRVIKQLYEISRTKDMINTDDVWITGILRNILGMTDEMLIKVESVVAKHLTGYYNKNPNKTKSRVLTLWKQCLKGYESQNWCTC